MDRLERLVNLVAALLDAQRPLTREELRRRIGGYASEPEAFRRTFERDKDVLRQMGMPLITEPIDPDRPDDQVGYRIPRERYELADPGLDDDELAALRLAASAVAMDGAWGRDATTTALRKLAATAGGPSSPEPAAPESAAPGRPGAAGGTDGPAMARLETSGGPTGEAVQVAAEVPGGDRVATAFAAVAERRRVTFAYRGAVRHVDPWRLSYRKGQWYLSGLDHDRKAERLFRLDRIDGDVAPTGPAGAFERPDGAATAPPPPWRLGDGDQILVRLAVDGPYARWVADEVGPDTGREAGPDGTMIFELAVTSIDGLLGLVLGLLDHAEVLGPPEVRTAVTDWLRVLARGPVGSAP